MTKIHTARVKRFTYISVNQLIRNSMMFVLGRFPTEYRGRQHLLRGWKDRRQEGKKEGMKGGKKGGWTEGRQEGRTEGSRGEKKDRGKDRSKV